MWTSLPTALMAILLLNQASAAHLHRRVVTIEACQSSTLTASHSAATKSAIPSTATPSEALVQESSDGEVHESAQSITASLSAQVAVASGISHSAASASGVVFYASGAARPTGHTNHSKNSTVHHSKTTKKITSTVTSLATSMNKTQSVPTLIISQSQKIATSSPALTSGKASSAAASSTRQPTSVLSTNKASSTFVSSAKPSSSAAKPSTTAISSSKPSSTQASSAPSGTAVTKIPFLRGVNLGGWLVAEKWMDSDLFSGSLSSAVDEWTLSSMSGAQAALKTHWDTFYTESDIASIAATGINALRIPIGFWAYDNANTPYFQGQDAYLEQAIGWARDNKMYVWVDCHGSPGSQNGFDNSGHAGDVEWQSETNLNRSISVLKTMAAKYGATEYADVVVGLEMTNEPISYGNNKFSVTQSWAQEAYAAVKAQVKNENMVVVMHDAFEGAPEWVTVAKDLLSTGPKTFGIDSHLYQLYTDSDNALTQAQHITEACGWSTQLATGNAVMPTYVGEWSAATNICVNSDGSTTAGTSCSTSGCQCQSADFDDWNSNMIEQVRKFVEAQLDTFEAHASGYFLWSAKGPGGWGFLNNIEKGTFPNPVTSRKYPGQCGSSGKRREVRGSLGVGGEKF